jgi:hypothetical protein
MWYYPASQSSVNAIAAKVDMLLAQMQTLLGQEKVMASNFADLATAVSAEQTVDGSIITLLNGIATQLADLKSKTNLSPADQAILDKAIADLGAEQANLAAAVTANTPVAPPTP